jgi:hypothetical protein
MKRKAGNMRVEHNHPNPGSLFSVPLPPSDGSGKVFSTDSSSHNIIVEKHTPIQSTGRSHIVEETT